MSGNLSNLHQRLLSGIVLAAITLTLTWLGGMPFRLLTVAIGAGVFVEWRKITDGRPKAALVKIAEFMLVAAFALLLAGLPPMVVFAAIIVAATVGFVAKFAGQASAWLGWGILYAGIPPASLAFLRGDRHDGLITVLFLFALVWATDIFAYFVGRSLGGPKMAPSISPGKTWSGAVGGTAAAVAAGLAVASLAGPVGNPALPVIIALVSVWSQIGDLFESWVKRRFGVKDSGTIIPGHGGIMDRVDALSAAASALYLVRAATDLF
jgi:phosphatidate cytidylyltransferase